MASDFVRNIKDVRNIDILSPNITTENDLISTKDGEVYVVTKKGYRKITGVETKEIKQLKEDVSNVKIQSDTNTFNISDLTDDIETNTSEIETLKTSTGNNTSEIETLETKTDDNKTSIDALEKKTDDNKKSINTLETDLNNMFTNTGWKDLKLFEGIEKYNDSETPQYKITKINNNTTISLRGSVKGITKRNTVIANIPLNDDLIQKHVFPQVCTLKRDKEDMLYAPINRWVVNNNGDIELVYMGIPENDIKGTEWCPISTTFDI